LAEWLRISTEGRWRTRGRFIDLDENLEEVGSFRTIGESLRGLAEANRSGSVVLAVSFCRALRLPAIDQVEPAPRRYLGTLSGYRKRLIAPGGER
jgi:hypothetical protein